MKKHNIPIYPHLILRLDLKDGSFEDAMKAINSLIDNKVNLTVYLQLMNGELMGL